MGRVLKRVPLWFDYPLDTVWEGYLCPFRSLPCPECKGRGESPEVRALYDRWYGNDRPPKWHSLPYQNRRWNKRAWNNNLSKKDVQALLEANRLWDFTRVPLNRVQREIVRRKMAAGENSWLPTHNGYRPTPEEVNRWNRTGMGHDSVNAYVVITAKAKRLGLPTQCAHCNGEGEFWPSEEVKAQAEAWTPSEPPEGEGYQLWETTSEGSPQSPVFATLDELCAWCAEHATTFGSFHAGAEQWKQMLEADFVHHQEGNTIFI